STFLQEDLTPALEQKGALVLYVDLWKKQDADPVDLISFTIANALAQQQGKIAKVAKAAGLTKVSIHGVEFSLDAVG
ncbi:ATP-binding protein, partial [Xanthomonas citri pv. citri]|nr:ATP-binding protein [Xanthomonas citri pv. citri]